MALIKGTIRGRIQGKHRDLLGAQPWWHKDTINGVEPNFVADFDEPNGGRYMSEGVEKSFTDLWNQVRSGIATYKNGAGILRTVGTDEPRFDHDGGTGYRSGYLFEEVRTNLSLRASDFTQASWLKSNTTIDADNAIGPDGTLSFDTLIENNDTNKSHTLSRVHTVVSGLSYLISVFAKPAGRSKIFIRRQLAENMPTPSDHYFDVLTGEVSGDSWDGIRITPEGNGIYRCSATFVATGSGTCTPSIGLLSDDDPAALSYDGDGVSGVHLWGHQLEEVTGAMRPSSFIDTVDATVTRPVDDLSAVKAGGLPYPGYVQSANTCVMEFRAHGKFGGNQQLMSYGQAVGERIDLYAGSTTMSIYAITGGQVKANTKVGDMNIGAWHKLCLSWDTDRLRCTVDGRDPVLDVPGPFPVPTTLLFGKAISSFNFTPGIDIRSFKAWPTSASVDQVRELSI